MDPVSLHSATIIPLSQPGCINVKHTRLELPLTDEHDVLLHLWVSNLMQLCSCVIISANQGLLIY